MNNATTTVIDFISRQCKDNMHGKCCARWIGLGFEIICSCKCKHNKNSQALEQVEEPFSNTNYSTPPVSVQGVRSRQ